jgi:hypothetical protein
MAARYRLRLDDRDRGLGHTLPYLIRILTATIFAIVVVVELAAISWIRYRYMDTPFLAAGFQIWSAARWSLAGILIGSS